MTLRVLQVIETGGPGGAETVFASLSSALASRGHAVLCATGQGSWLPDEMLRRGLPTERLHFRGAFDRALYAQLRALIKSHRADVVHAHLFDGSVYAALAARQEGVPCVVTLHGQVDVQHAGWRMALKRWLLTQTATRVVTVSEALRHDMTRSFGAAAMRFAVVHNGVVAPADHGVHGHASRPDLPRWVQSGEATVVRLVAIGNIRQPKGYPQLLKAVHLLGPLLSQRGLEVHLDVAGEPDREGLYQALQEQVRDLGLSAQVTFHGFVRDPGPLLAGADMFVLASTKEGFSLATIEAMLRGVPVVATRSGGPEEILTDRTTGVLVNAGDARALAEGIVWMIDHPDATQHMRAHAMADAVRRFSLDAMVDGYLALYNTVLTRV